MRRGVTLIEVMIATAILAIVAAMVWAGFSQSSRTITSFEASQDRYHEAQVALSVLARDLASAFLSMHVNPNEPTAEYVFVAEDRSPVDRLDFVAFSHQRRMRDVHESDQCEVGYYGAPDEEDRQLTNLVRRESPIIDDEPREGGRRLVLLRDVVELALTYYDGDANEWLEHWNTTEVSGQPQRLPDQVRILLTIHDDRGRELALTTQVPVHLRQPLLFGRRGL